MAALMIYGIAIGLALAVVGVMLEHVAALGGQPRRGVWAGMIVGVVLLLGALPWRVGAPEAPTLVTGSPFVVVGASAVTAGDVERQTWWLTLRHELRAGTDSAAASAARLDAYGRWMWMSASLAMALVYALGQWTLSRRRRQWRADRVCGVPVLVAPEDGPALIGILRPQIVLPKWALGLEARALDLMIRHEQEHGTSRDPLLIHLASLIVLAMPWNPAAWWMVSRLRLAVELDCDARVLRRVQDNRDAGSSSVSVYGELLLAVAERRSPRRALIAPTLIEHASTLRRRISAMYPSRIRLRILRATASSSAAFVLIALTLALPAPRVLAQTSTPTVREVMAQPSLATMPNEASVAGTPATPARVLPASTVRRAPVADRVGRRAAPVPAAQRETAQTEPVYQVGNGVASPVLIFKADPAYTTAAMAAKTQGVVWLDGIVEKDGTLSTLSVSKSLDPTFGLDQSALDAARKWKFKPGMKDGEPVRVAVQLILEFRLKPTVYTADTPGIVVPVVRDHAEPTYTSDAMRAKIQGTVKIEAEVQIDGTVGEARIVESLDQVFGLDESALKAARQWTFEPGTLNGTAVPVRVLLTLEFRLH